MANAQVRLIAAAIALLAGGIMANTNNIDVNLSLTVILISSAIFIVEYWRCRLLKIYWVEIRNGISRSIHAI